MFRVTTSIPAPTGWRHIHVGRNYRTGLWELQWANPTEFGYHFDPPFEDGFRTKKEALARRRELYDQGVQ